MPGKINLDSQNRGALFEAILDALIARAEEKEKEANEDATDN